MSTTTVTTQPFADRDGNVILIVKHGCMIEHLKLGKLSFDSPEQISAAAVRALAPYGLDADAATAALEAVR